MNVSTNTQLMDMIGRLMPEDLHAVKSYVAFLLNAREKSFPTEAEKREALQHLSKHRGILAGANREALRESAMEEKYGRVS